MSFRERYPGLDAKHYAAVAKVFRGKNNAFLAALDRAYANQWAEVNATDETMDDHRLRLGQLALHGRATLYALTPRSKGWAEGPYTSDLFSDGGHSKFVGDLEAVIAAADRLVADSDALREARGEQPGRRKQLNGPSRNLWPLLIDAYAAKGELPSASEGSLFMKILRAAHAALKLPEPAPSSVARALKRRPEEHRIAANLMGTRSVTS